MNATHPRLYPAPAKTARTVLPLLGVALTILTWRGSPALALVITIGTETIEDNGPKDIEPADDIIKFSTEPQPVFIAQPDDPATPDIDESEIPVEDDLSTPAVDESIDSSHVFTTPAGSSVNIVFGTVQVGGSNGALARILGKPAQILSLTDFEAFKNFASTGNKPLAISFEHPFDKPAAGTVKAADAIVGSLTNQRPARLSKDEIKWHGSVNDTKITPKAAPTSVKTPDPPEFIDLTLEKISLKVSGTHGDKDTEFTGGPPWTLKGELSVKLGLETTSLILPTSAEVGVGGSLLPDLLTLGPEVEPPLADFVIDVREDPVLAGLGDMFGPGTIGILGHTGAPDGKLPMWFEVTGLDPFELDVLAVALTFSQDVIGPQQVGTGTNPLLPEANLWVEFAGGPPPGEIGDIAVGYDFGDEVAINGFAAAIPEPSTLVLLTMGSLALLAYARRGCRRR